MTRETDADLISVTYELDDDGQEVAAETKTTVPCSKHGITRQEWTAATTAQQGLRPTMMIRIRDELDYKGQEIVEVDGIRYAVYRTYLLDDGGIELYLQKEDGV